MRKMIVFLAISLMADICCAGDALRVYYEYGYVVGYESGIEDRERGEKRDPEGYYNLPLMQAAREVIMGKGKNEINDFNEQDFNWHFKKGFVYGYNDGYLGKPKIKFEYEWANSQSPGGGGYMEWVDKNGKLQRRNL